LKNFWSFSNETRKSKQARYQAQQAQQNAGFWQKRFCDSARPYQEGEQVTLLAIANKKGRYYSAFFYSLFPLVISLYDFPLYLHVYMCIDICIFMYISCLPVP
jgi:hypothetical protein